MKGRSYPFLGGRATQIVGRPVDAAGENERVEVVGSRLDVVAVDAHAGRAEEPKPFGVCRGDLYALQIDLNSRLAGHALNKLAHRVVIWATFEVQKLNVLRRHDWTVARPAILES